MLQPSAGSTSTSPPSPPKLETIFWPPGLLRRAIGGVAFPLRVLAPAGGVDDPAPPVPAEVGDLLRAAGRDRRPAVVLQTAADQHGVAAGVQVGARRVVGVQLADTDV